MQGIRSFFKTYLLWELFQGPVGHREGHVSSARSR